MLEEELSEESEIFEEDEVIWAKVKGHPWWPGFVYLFLIID